VVCVRVMCVCAFSGSLFFGKITDFIRVRLSTRNFVNLPYSRLVTHRFQHLSCQSHTDLLGDGEKKKVTTVATAESSSSAVAPPTEARRPSFGFIGIQRGHAAELYSTSMHRSAKKNCSSLREERYAYRTRRSCSRITLQHAQVYHAHWQPLCNHLRVTL
jgi:hypothetical protein